MQTDSFTTFATAVNEFRQARRQAQLERLLAVWQGRSPDLLSFNSVRQQLSAHISGARHLEEIPIAAIVGSVGRHDEFTRSFLPKSSQSAERWVGVRLAVDGLMGLEPIEVYQLGEAYFVLDGNHRVSVANQVGATHIQAYVQTVQLRVPFTPEMDANQLICQVEYAAFVAESNLDKYRPSADLSMTIPGQFQKLREHIAVHHYFMGQQATQPVAYEEAVADWYDVVYTPVATFITNQNMLAEIPGRTITDLYVWLVEHRGELEEQLAWTAVDMATVADHWRQQEKRPIATDPQLRQTRHEAFRTSTGLALSRPTAELHLHDPADYAILEEHIATHRYFMGVDEQREVSVSKAAEHWYDAVYLPIQRVIETEQLWRLFPDETEATLYLLITNQQKLEDADSPDATTIAQHLTPIPAPSRLLERAARWLRELPVPLTIS